MWQCGNRQRRSSASVASASASVSPGNPAMMSVASSTPGTPSRSTPHTRSNSATLYSRRMPPSTASLPDCTGTCR